MLEPKWAEEVVHAGQVAHYGEAGPEWVRRASVFRSGLAKSVRKVSTWRGGLVWDV